MLKQIASWFSKPSSAEKAYTKGQQFSEDFLNAIFSDRQQHLKALADTSHSFAFTDHQTSIVQFCAGVDALGAAVREYYRNISNKLNDPNLQSALRLNELAAAHFLQGFLILYYKLYPTMTPDNAQTAEICSTVLKSMADEIIHIPELLEMFAENKGRPSTKSASGANG